jgi:hypothetical protein
MVRLIFLAVLGYGAYHYIKMRRDLFKRAADLDKEMKEKYPEK